MNLEPTDYQRLMVDTFRAFFQKESTPDAVRAADKTGGHDARLWAGFSRLGGPLLSVPEPAGGGGGTLLDATLVGLEAGRCLAPIGYADHVVAARTLVQASGAGWDDLPVGDAYAGWAPAWAGEVTVSAGRLHGRLRWTRTGAAASWLVVDLGSQLALVDLDTAGVTRRPSSNLGCFPMAAIDFDGAAVAGVWAFPDDQRSTARTEARVLAAAELIGAGRQALELARLHVLDRRQFDRPVASFQAIQHRLADRHTALEGAELLLWRAASDPDPFTAAVTLFRAAEAGELAAKEALQFFGGYGFTLEYDIHLYLRFAKSLAALARDPFLVDDASSGRMRRSEPQRRAAAEAEAFFDTHLTGEMIEQAWESGTLHDAGLHRAIAGRGWIGAWWPAEYGGLGLSALEAGAIAEVAYRRNAPIVAQVLTEFAGYAILVHGTAEQRAEFLPAILAGERLIALGFSEPDAGSDVAAVQTKAEPVDGGYRITGSKMFTTMAHASDFVFLLARTDPAAAKHRGLSMFLVPLDAPGVEIRPVETFGGERTNATFYDDVFVPESRRVGAENDGWAVLGAALTVERAAVGSYVGEARRTFDALVDALSRHRPGASADPHVRARLADWSARIEAAAVLADRVGWLLDRGGEPTVEAAMTKLAVTDAFKDLSHEALDLVGPEGLADDTLVHSFRHSQVATIYGGSNEIQRNLIAQRALGLPRN